MASITPMSFFTPDASINPDEYTFEIADAQARKFSNVTVLTSAFDMNDILTPGIYRADMSVTSITNWPHVDGWMYFSVYGDLAGGTRNRMQVVYGGRTTSAAGGRFYVRHRNNGTWGAWCEYKSAREVPSVASSNVKIRYGTLTLSNIANSSWKITQTGFTGSNNQSVSCYYVVGNISYGITYTNAPAVLVSPLDNGLGAFNAEVESRTTTGATLMYMGPTKLTSCSVFWMAIGV